MKAILPPVDVIIPFYKNAALVEPLFKSLEAIAAELNAAGCSVLAINDSPGDAELETTLVEAVGRAGRRFQCKIQRNQRNLGFVRSVNQALQAALASGHDVLLLNSDTTVFPGSIAEVRRVAYLDPMTGFVSPRSNNATICSLPHPSEFSHQPPAESYNNCHALARYLPDYHYTPTAVGFCLYIKFLILDEFGLFDEVYGNGYNEENDLIMRANRAGFRAVLANHAFVYHIGECSFSTAETPKQLLEGKNAEILSKRYPEYLAGVSNYFESVHYEAEQMLTAMLPDAAGKLDLVFDFSNVGPYHNGTFEVAKRILKCAVKAWKDKFNIFVMATNEAIHFHKLDQVAGAFFVTPETRRVYAIAFRIGQPFSYEQLFRMSHTGVLNVYSMLDPIALDCLYLNQADLPVLWNSVMSHADGIIYISDFVGEQFRRRFRLGPAVKELVAYLSLDLQDYATAEDSATEAGGHILVIGNAFQHKRMPVTVEALSSAFPREKIVALGYNSDNRQNVIAYPSGNLSEARMANLLRGAKFVVYPSTYEGFGIPVVESLAYGRPVLARSIPVLRDIRRMLPSRENLVLYDSTRDLINRLKVGFPVWNPPRDNGNGQSLGWETVTCRIGDFLDELTQNWSVCNNLLPRLEHMRLLRQPARSPESPAAQPISELSSALRDSNQRIADLENSMSWKITAPLRRALDAYRRLQK